MVEVEGKSGLVGLLGGRGELGYDEVTYASGLGPGGRGELRARTITPAHALVDYFEEHGMRRLVAPARSQRACSTSSPPPLPASTTSSCSAR